MPFGDVPCPNCGCLLWYVATVDDTKFFVFEESTTIRERVIQHVADVLGIDENEVRENPGVWKKRGADSLDLVEVMIDFDNEFGERDDK